MTKKITLSEAIERQKEKNAQIGADINPADIYTLYAYGYCWPLKTIAVEHITTPKEFGQTHRNKKRKKK